MNMGIGFSELIMISALVLMFFGSKEIPFIIREIARLTAKIRRYTESVRRELNAVTRELDPVNTAKPFSDDIRQKKKALRTTFLQAMKSLSADDRAAQSGAVVEHIIATEQYRTARSVMIYASMNAECDTSTLIRQILADGKRCVLPFVRTDSETMGIAAISDPQTDLLRGTYGIMEPVAALRDNFFKSDLQLILCPGVAFDEGGVRLGRGKGYYDTFLRELKGSLPIWGVCLRCQVATMRLPYYYNDVTVDQVITPDGPLIPLPSLPDTPAG